MPLQGTLLADFDAFTNAVANAQTSLKGFETDAAKVETSLTRMTSAVEGGKIVQQATLAAQAIEDIGGVSKLTTAELEKWSAIASEATAKLTAMGKDVPPQIQALADATTNAHGAWSAFVDDFKVTDAIEHPIATATQGMSALAESMGPAAVAALGVGSAVAAIGTAFYELTSRAAESGERLQDFSVKTGMSVPEVSKLSKALNVAGGDMDGVGNALFILERNMGEMTPKFQAGMDRLRISSDDFKDAGIDGYLDLIATRLAATDDPIQRTTALAELFGRQGRELAPVLDKLAASLALTSDFTPWTPEQAKAAEEFQMAMRSLQLHVESYVVSIGKDFLGPANLFLDAINASKDGVVGFADTLTGGLFTAIGVAREALRAGTDIAEVFERKLEDVKSVMGDLPEPIDQTASAFERWADYVIHFSWGQFSKDVIKETAAAVHVLADDIGQLPEIGGPALAHLGASTRDATKALDALQLTGKTVTMSASETAAAIRELDAPLKAAKDAADKYAAAWAELNSTGTTYKDTVALINPKIVEQAEYYLKAGNSIATVAAAFPELSAAQAKALDEMVKQYDATYKAIQKIEGDHVKQAETNMFGLSKAENDESQKRLTNQGKAADQLIALDRRLSDEYAQQSMSRAAYEETKLWEAADQQIAAFTKTGATAQQVTEFANKLYEETALKASQINYTAANTLDNITDKGIQDMLRLVKAQQDAVDAAAKASQSAIQSMQGGTKLPGSSQETDFGQNYLVSPTGAKVPLGPGGTLPKNWFDLYAGKSSFPQFAGGVENFAGGLAIVGEQGPELVNLPSGSSVLPAGGFGGVSVTNHIYVNGTAADVARQVAAEIMRSLKSTQQLTLR